MEKQPLQTECFEEAFLDYLRLRFEFEPLAHYVMAAMHICDETSREYPQFVRAFMTWFAESFLFDRKGTFPAESHNADPADHRWRRFKDCHDLLEGWHSDDLKGALEAQEERWELVERVAELRLEERDETSAPFSIYTVRTRPSQNVFPIIQDGPARNVQERRTCTILAPQIEHFF